MPRQISLTSFLRRGPPAPPSSSQRPSSPSPSVLDAHVLSPPSSTSSSTSSSSRIVDVFALDCGNDEEVRRWCALGKRSRSQSPGVSRELEQDTCRDEHQPSLSRQREPFVSPLSVSSVSSSPLCSSSPRGTPPWSSATEKGNIDPEGMRLDGWNLEVFSASAPPVLSSVPSHRRSLFPDKKTISNRLNLNVRDEEEDGFSELPSSRQAESTIDYEYPKWLVDPRDESGKRPGENGYDARTLYIPPRELENMTGFMRQYWEIKKNAFDCVLFYKKGKFYETFCTDADIVHQELNLHLSQRGMPMAGVPESSFQEYAAKLVAKGYKVGRVDQMETMSERTKKNAKGPCERQLTQMLTAGTLVDLDMLESVSASYLFAVKEDTPRYGTMGSSRRMVGYCFVDASTSKFYAGTLEDDEDLTGVEGLLFELKPKEILYEKGCISSRMHFLLTHSFGQPIVNALRPVEEFLSPEQTRSWIANSSYFDKANSIQQSSLTGMLQDDISTSAFGSILWYLAQLKLDEELVSQGKFHRYDQLSSSCVQLSTQTLMNLNILGNENDGSSGSVFSIVNHTRTAFGARLLKRWLCHPLRSIDAISSRLDAIEDFRSSPDFERQVDEVLRCMTDVERQLSRIHAFSLRRAEGVMYSGQERKKISIFQQLVASLNAFSKFMLQISESSLKFRSSDLSRIFSFANELHPHGLPNMNDALDYFSSCYDAHATSECGFLVPHMGVVSEYDMISARVLSIEQNLEDLLVELRESLRCRELSFKHQLNQPYQIEAPIRALKNVQSSDGYEEVSKTKQHVRFYVPRVVELIAEHTEAVEEREKILRDVLRSIFEQFDVHYVDWIRMIDAISTLDCLHSLFVHSTSCSSQHLCRPRVLSSDCATFEEPFLHIREGSVLPGYIRLPSGSDFVSNTISLGGEDAAPLVLLTGPNMGGKSTICRQVCLTVLLAQVGFWVPAKEMEFTPVDAIFTRVGAQDRIMNGESTFFVELKETAEVLRRGTKHSLVILDELGRGTSTFDGYAVAYAVMSAICSSIQCRCMFATHYHMLSEDLLGLASVSLYHMACIPMETGVTFLYKYTKGVCPKSYGLDVARFAGIPDSVVDEARRAAASLEADACSRRGTSASIQSRIQVLRKILSWIALLQNSDVSSSRIHHMLSTLQHTVRSIVLEDQVCN